MSLRDLLTNYLGLIERSGVEDLYSADVEYAKTLLGAWDENVRTSDYGFMETNHDAQVVTHRGRNKVALAIKGREVTLTLSASRALCVSLGNLAKGND